jgi:dUTP pyrophosphatase
MEREDIEDYINKLKKIERNLSDDDSFDLKYISELDSLLNKLRSDVTDSYEQVSENPDEAVLMFKLKVKIMKLHENAVVPKYSKEGDAGLDLTATQILNEDSQTITYGTGLAFEIPMGYVGLVFPRSSIRKYELQLSNSVGVIDSGYRGEVQATFNKIHNGLEIYKVGDRVAQMIILPHPHIDFIETQKLSNTERGSGGFGSTGS